VSVRVSTGSVVILGAVASGGLRVEVRLCPAELSRWRAMAARSDIGVSEFVRRRVNGALAGGFPREMPELDRALEGVGGWREVFLEALRDGRSVAAACRVAGVSRTIVYRERARSRELRVAWELALGDGDRMVDERLHDEQGALSRSLRRAPLQMLDRGVVGGDLRRSARLQLRLDRVDLEAWQRASAELGLAVSELVRRLVTGPGLVAGAAMRAPVSWRVVFVEALRRSGSVTAACRVAGVSRTLAYREREGSRAFAFAWEYALEEAKDRVVACLWELGMVGVPRVKRRVRRTADGLVASVTTTQSSRRSERALIELLRVLAPEEWDFEP
jgi:hypothetical protein